MQDLNQASSKLHANFKQASNRNYAGSKLLLIALNRVYTEIKQALHRLATGLKQAEHMIQVDIKHNLFRYLANIKQASNRLQTCYFRISSAVNCYFYKPKKKA